MVRILLADDRMVARRGLRELLETCQHFLVCAEACNGREAVELAVNHRPDVAILELSLPIVDGIEATRQIRKEIPATEVLIFTLQNGESNIRRALDAGARGYVFKSEADEQIVKAIEALAQHRRFLSSEISEALLENSLEDQSTGNQSIALTAREREVVRLIAEGKSNKTIAYLLDISVKTVETHRSASMRKLNVHSTAQLVHYAIRCRLIVP
jgi:DNA-binding NarL/FixJ family response regulator